MDGELSGTEVVFSNQSIHGKQVITKMKTLLRSDDNNVAAELSEIGLTDGNCDGKVSCKFDPSMKNGDCSVNISALNLSPVIQNLMSGGISSPISLSGKAHLAEGHLSSWKGQAQWKSTEGHGWKVADPKLETAYQDERFSLKVHVQEADLGAEFPYSDLVQSIVGQVPSDSPWRFKDASGSLTIVRTGGEIKDARVRGPLGRGYRFHGEWERGGDLSGTLNTDSNAKKWKVSGREGKLVLDEIQ